MRTKADRLQVTLGGRTLCSVAPPDSAPLRARTWRPMRVHHARRDAGNPDPTTPTPTPDPNPNLTLTLTLTLTPTLTLTQDFLPTTANLHAPALWDAVAANTVYTHSHSHTLTHTHNH